MLIACDVDGVLADLSTEWLRRYNADYNDTLTAEQITGPDISQFVKPECGQLIHDYLVVEHLYESVPRIPGALSGVLALREAGHQVLFCTSCSFNMVDQKAEWLVSNGYTVHPRPDRLPTDLVVVATEHKARYLAADLIIEDSAAVVHQWVTETRRRAVVFTQPWNRSLDLPSMFWSWCHRADNWAEVVSHLVPAKEER